MKKIVIISIITIMLALTGCADNDNNTVPVANAGKDQQVPLGATVILKGSESSSDVTYSWSFVSIPETSTTVISDPTIANPLFIADVEGIYEIALVVNNGEVNSEQDITKVVVSSDNESSTNYVSGEIIVGFNDTVTEQEADDFIKSYGLTWTSNFPKLFSYWVKITKDSDMDYMEQLNNSEIVLWAKKRGYSEGESRLQYILVQFNIKATNETAQALINSFDNLEIISKNLFPKSGLVNVEKGKEQDWINTLKNESIVEYAQLNYIASIANIGITD